MVRATDRAMVIGNLTDPKTRFSKEVDDAIKTFVGKRESNKYGKQVANGDWLTKMIGTKARNISVEVVKEEDDINELTVRIPG